MDTKAASSQMSATLAPLSPAGPDTLTPARAADPARPAAMGFGDLHPNEMLTED